ncbi:uncharacterized protein HD556DRAFT_1413358 [Suillus plorans]|uniref:Uncharacterized protein n=1 Tax=Suillus plorans TaxID=116603 RepID=A0A9P7ACX2_9AGAM|nr:uncharacterized protein HD556DRAFT_1413358 [Suillus plorans]KAG1786772.1 hypothetical protein HD556DRAFT_1413358 [Suillus plorans]
MSRLLPVLAFVLALQSVAVAANSSHLREPVFMPARDNGSGSDDDDDDDDDDISSTATTHHTTSTSASINQFSTSITFTTHSSSSFFLGSSFSSSNFIPTPTSTSASTITTHPSSTSITQSSSVSTIANTDMSISSSLSYASTTSGTSSSSLGQHSVHGVTPTAGHGLSTGARASLSCGIMFSLILSALVVCYFRKRSSRPWDRIMDESTISSSEVSQYFPHNSIASLSRGVLPPPRLDTAHPYPPDISHSPPLLSIPRAASMNDDSCIEIYTLYLRGAPVMDNKYLPTQSQRPPALRRMRPQAFHEHTLDPMALGSLQLPH